MKIGVLTFHCAHNYGAMLQTYATQEMLKSAGHEVEIIDYRPCFLREPYKRIRPSRIRSKKGGISLIHVASEILLFPFRCIRYSSFMNFMNQRMNLSARVDRETFDGNYDAIIIGSDQVWNIRHNKGKFDPMYLADFRFPKENRVYIADAVSLELDLIGPEEEDILREAVGRFDALSVREEFLVDWFRKITSKEFTHIQDPVFQLDTDRWMKLVKPHRRRKPYVFVYRMVDHESITPFVKKLAARYDYDIIEVQAFPNAKTLHRSRQAVGVEEFLSLLSGAAFVVTTSFHGTAFSVIFQKPFYCFSFGYSVDTRVRSLLDSIRLGDRMLPIGTDLPEDVSCDYADAVKLLEQQRIMSRNFILDQLRL
ncbi:MAG: polysaccharide pyruvyl transferase family protein [Bacteroidales bacterium]|nr:polysaccharide pyruvyl transferase family protein [Bacteroidales bacterium]